MKGGSLSSQDLKWFLKASYNRSHSDYKDFRVDKQLTGQRVQVYHNPQTKQTVVVHRGTKGFHDAVTDLRYTFGDKSSKRFQHSTSIQRQAEQKYGAKNVTAVGHSLGSVLGETVGNKSKEILTLNKPVCLADLHSCIPSHQTDIRASRDPVSLLRPFQRGQKAVTIPSLSLDPFKEHSTNTLDRTATLFGSGITDGRCLYCV